MADLYWIRTAEMTDMFSEGYIGISTISAEHRWHKHKIASSSNRTQHLPIYRAFRKYGVENLKMEVLVSGPTDYTLYLENKLRPLPGIGWNCACGGQATAKGRKHTDAAKAKMSAAHKGKTLSVEHRQKCSVSLTGKKHSVETRKLMSKSSSGMTKEWTESGRKSYAEFRSKLHPWNNPKADIAVWKRCSEISTMLADNKLYADILRHFNFDRRSGKLGSIFRKIKSGWKPDEDTDYLTWLDQTI